MKPWRHDMKSHQWGFDNALQWGHGGEAVETPRGMRCQKWTTRLQWGHGGEAVETRVDLIWSSTKPLLQWGHGGEAVETRR